MKAVKFSRLTGAIGLAALTLAASPAYGQLLAAKEGAVVFSHVGLNVTQQAEHQKFWALIGGLPINPFGTGGMFQFPNIFVSPRSQASTGGTKGTSVNHIGFQVPDLGALLDRIRAEGYVLATRAELQGRYETKNDIAFVPDQNTSIAFVMLPGDLKVEFVEAKGLAMPIALHHIHFASQDVNAMKAWYVKALNAKPGRRGSFEAADLPGVNLTFGASAEPVIGTVGRVLDHISFEVKNLEAFCRELEARGIELARPYSMNTSMNLGVAFLTDPWGTSIELTEGYAAKNAH